MVVLDSSWITCVQRLGVNGVRDSGMSPKLAGVNGMWDRWQ